MLPATHGLLSRAGSRLSRAHSCRQCWRLAPVPAPIHLALPSIVTRLQRGNAAATVAKKSGGAVPTTTLKRHGHPHDLMDFLTNGPPRGTIASAPRRRTDERRYVNTTES